MKPDWDTLAEEFKDSKTVVIADVDCTAEGEPLCSRFQVEGFPTLKSFSPPDTDGEDYEGGRELDELRAHAASLGPGCSLSAKELCSAEDLAALEVLVVQPAAELQAEIVAIKAQLAASNEAHEELVKALRAQFDASEQALKALEKKSGARLKLLRAAGGSCDDDPTFKDRDDEGCAAYQRKPAFACGHEGYEEACARCCATCASAPKCTRLASEAKPKDEV